MTPDAFRREIARLRNRVRWLPCHRPLGLTPAHFEELRQAALRFRQTQLAAMEKGDAIYVDGPDAGPPARCPGD